MPIREPQSVARLSRAFSRSLTAVDLAEPSASLDENQPLALGAELMRTRDLSVLGVRRAGLVAGWVGMEDLTDGTLGECARKFCREQALDESAGLDSVLGAFSTAKLVFIEWRGEVAAVIFPLRYSKGRSGRTVGKKRIRPRSNSEDRKNLMESTPNSRRTASVHKINKPDDYPYV